MTTKDSNGTPLNDGDSVQVIKDVKVKGTSVTLKRGTVIKNIRLTEDEEVHRRLECGRERPQGVCPQRGRC